MRVWLESEIARSKDLIALGPLELHWTSLDSSTLSPDEIESLRREVRGHPEHPRKMELALAEAQTLNAIIPQHFRVLISGEKTWRYNADLGPGTFRDTALTPRTPWSMSGRTIWVYDRAAVDSSNDGNSVKGTETEFLPIVDRFVFGRLGVAATMGLKIKSIECSGDTWTAVLGKSRTDVPQYELKYRGMWDARGSKPRGYVTSFRILKSDYKPATVGEGDDFEGWSALTGSETVVAHVSRYLRANGKVWRTLTLDEVAVPDQARVTSALATPSNGSRDAFRGDIAVEQVVDNRAGTLTSSDAQGNTHTQPIKSAFDSGGKTWLKIAGWVALGVLVLAFSVVRFLRSQSTHVSRSQP